MKGFQKNILQFDISPLAKGGIHSVNMQNEEREEHDISKPHRDNHFLLMLAVSGYFNLNIDFKEIVFSQSTLFCVFPEQVHYIIEAKNPKGWIISFDPSVIDKETRQVFESKFQNPILMEQESDFYLQSYSLMNLIESLQANKPNKFATKSISSLLNSFLNLIASNLVFTSPIENITINRGTVIRNEFNELLKKKYKTWKKPAQYASQLAISVSHLNDTIKTLTGSPVSTHIQQISILEAKRQLCFTNKSVKEIGYEVGYEEPVYFGKLFKKMTNFTPLAFRRQFRD